MAVKNKIFSLSSLIVIAIVAVIFMNVFDDSTSALDMETEQEIQKVLKSITESSKIIIAHRISAVRNADEIIYLHEGRVAERGTHSELLAKKGLYYETYLAQYPELKKEVV